MSCLRSNFLTRRTTASTARSIIRLETYHSGILSFSWGAVGWQRSSGMVLHPGAGQHFDDIDHPIGEQSEGRNAVQRPANAYDIAGGVNISVKQTKDHEYPRQDDEYQTGLVRHIGQNGQDI